MISFIIFLFSFVFCEIIYIPSHLKSFQPFTFNLRRDRGDPFNTSYTVLSYDNLLDEGDKSELIIHFDRANSFTANMYVYTSLEAIKVNKEEQFINYNWTFLITDKKEYIINDDKYEGNGTYYFVILEKNEKKAKEIIEDEDPYFAYFYHDTVRIYNAKSINEIKKSECFVFNQIYSTNTFYFMIPTINKKESFHYQIKDINQNSAITFAMSETNSTEVKDLTTSTTYIDQYADIVPSSYYHIQVKVNQKDPSVGNVIEICFTLNPTKAVPIEYNETEYEANMIAQTKLYYYLNITSISQNKQGSLLLERSYQEATDVEPITVKCAETNYNSYSDIGNVVKDFKDESKCIVTKDNNYDGTHFQIVFTKGTANALVIEISINEVNAYPYLTTYLSLSKESQELKANTVQKIGHLTSPRYYILNSQTLGNKPVVIFTNHDSIMKIYSGKSIVADEANLISTHQLYVYDSESPSPLTIKLYGQMTYENVLLETRYIDTNNNTVVSSFKDERVSTNYKILIPKCEMHNFILFGVYKKERNNFLYINTLYGDIKARYISSYENAMNFTQLIPTEENSIVLSDDSHHVLTSNFDIINVTCSSPSLAFINILDYKSLGNDTLKEGSIEFYTVNEGEERIISVSAEKGVQYEINVFSNESDVFELKATIDDKEITINKEDYIIRGSFESEGGTHKIILNSKNNRVLLNIKIGTKELSNTYHILEEKKEVPIKDNSNILFIYDKEKALTTKRAKISIAFKSSEIYTICTYENFGSKETITVPSAFDCSQVKTSVTYSISNPYSKNVPNRKNHLDNDIYYLSIIIQGDLSEQAKISLEYDEKNNLVNVTENSFINTISSSLFSMGTDRDSDELLIQFATCNNANVTYELYSADELQIANATNSKYFSLITKNQKIKNEISLTGGNTIFRYMYMNKSDYVYNPPQNYEINVKPDLVNKSLTVEFTPFLYNETISYDIIIMNTSFLKSTEMSRYTSLSKNQIDFDNECFLFNLTTDDNNKEIYTKFSFEKYANNETNETFINYTMNMGEAQHDTYVVTIIARQKENYQMRATYYAQVFNYKEKGIDGIWIFFMISGGIILLVIIIYFIHKAVKNKGLKIDDIKEDKLMPNSFNDLNEL